MLERHVAVAACTVVVVAAMAMAQQPTTQLEALGPPVTADDVGQGCVLVTDDRGHMRPLPTVSTDVQIVVSGLIVRVHLEQEFHNPTDRWLEGVYVFPLPSGAAVDQLQLRVGERIIEGQIREREQARQEYEQAKAAGKKASLVEQQRPNMFTTAVANLAPDETVAVTIAYQETLRYDAGQLELRFPMVVGPRYIPGQQIELGPISSTGWAMPTDQVPDAHRITPPVAEPERGPVNPVHLDVELDAGFPLATLESPSHPIVTTNHNATRHHIELDPEQQWTADRDFVLRWAPRLGAAPQAAVFSEQLEGQPYMLVMVVPPAADETDQVRLSREVVFVIDTSGSMHGASIAQARSALELSLERLPTTDSFNVIAFASSARSLFDQARPATQVNVQEALRWVRQLRADGGTEMAAALRLALNDRHGDPSLRPVRQVVFITDGCVGNEAQLFEQIRRDLGRSRLFTVGIGSAPNGHFMRRAAEHGRGTFTFIADPGEVAARMQELFAKLESPVLSDIEVEFEDAAADMAPGRIPDLYAGEPVVVAARLAFAGTSVEVRGRRGQQPWSVQLPVDSAAEHTGVAKLWARRRIASLIRDMPNAEPGEKIREQIVALALRHHLVSKFTSLVAIDVTPTRPQSENLDSEAVPTNLPHGWTHSKVFGGPNTATPRHLLLLLALLTAASALGVLRWGRR